MAYIDSSKRKAFDDYVDKIKDKLLEAIEKDDFTLVLKAIDSEKFYNLYTVVSDSSEINEAIYKNLRMGKCSILLKRPDSLIEDDMGDCVLDALKELYGEKAADLAWVYGEVMFNRAY